ncbi:unnamed protein product [Camellia sinensis]
MSKLLSLPTPPNHQQQQQERKKRGMARFEDAIPILINVLLRKSISILCELACLILGFVSIANSMIRFSGFFIRRSNVISSRYSPMSSVLARHDR